MLTLDLANCYLLYLEDSKRLGVPAAQAKFYRPNERIAVIERWLGSTKSSGLAARGILSNPLAYFRIVKAQIVPVPAKH